MNSGPIPMWLRLWLAVQVISLVIAPLLQPHVFMALRSVFWFIVMMLIGWALWERSKAAWIGALLLAAWAVYASAMTLFVWNPNLRIQPAAWFVFGLVKAVVELALLLSPSARRWVNASASRQSVSVESHGL